MIRKYLGKITVLISLVFFFVVTTFWLFGLEVVFTKDASLPYQLYISRPLKELRKGMIATFWHSQSKRMFGKQVIGIEGDVIETHSGHIFVDGKDYGEIKRQSKSGKTYEPILPCTIPNGYCFVYGTNEYSFDSRYKEMGLIPVHELQREMWPIF